MMSVWRMKGLKEGLIWRSPTVILLVPSCLIYHAASSCLSVWPARFSRPDWAQNKSLNSSYIPPSSPSFHTEYACNISYGFRQCWMLKTLTALRHLPSLPHFLPPIAAVAAVILVTGCLSLITQVETNKWNWCCVAASSSYSISHEASFKATASCTDLYLGASKPLYTEATIYVACLCCVASPILSSSLITQCPSYQLIQLWLFCPKYKKNPTAIQSWVMYQYILW